MGVFSSVRWLPLICAVAFAGLCARRAITDHSPVSWILGSAGVLLGLAAALSTRRGVVVDDEGVTVREPGRAKYLWDDVARISIECAEAAALPELTSVPVLYLRESGAAIELSALAFFRIRRGSRPRRVRRLVRTVEARCARHL